MSFGDGPADGNEQMQRMAAGPALAPIGETSSKQASLDAAAEAILSVLAVRGYVDDVAIMPRTRDMSAAAEAIDAAALEGKIPGDE